jgi:NAD(P)-dependent dehydrogenase (short-subunit alcohol dehydrogenase family)
MEFLFKGQTALVTGSAQGLGREIALALAQHGASRVLADKVFPSDTAEVIQESGGTALALKADISLEADVQELVRQALEHHQRIDILVNNAGVSQLNFSPSEETSIQEWKTIIDIDLIGSIGLGVEGEPLGGKQYPLFTTLFGRKSPYGVVTCVPESIPEKLKAFLVVGGNPVNSMADSNAFRESFQKLESLLHPRAVPADSEVASPKPGAFCRNWA